MVWFSLPARFKYAVCSLTQNVCTFHMLRYLGIRGPYEFVGVIGRLKDYNKTDRLIHSTEAAIFDDRCSILKLEFKILYVTLLFINVAVDLLFDLLKLCIHLLLHLLKPCIHLFEAFIHPLLHLFQTYIHQLKAPIHLLFHVARSGCNNFTLPKKLLLHS